MAAMAGLIQHSLTATQALSGKSANPMAASTSDTSGTGSSDSSSATISANDFLSLLVTEMQNQDPTANTDPNEYINQLVQVNSLEQLISINQNLSTALGSSSGSSGTGSGSVLGAVGTSATTAPGLPATNPANTSGPSAAVAHKTGSLSSVASAGTGVAGAIGRFAQSVGAKKAPGNLEIPTAAPASRSVAHALDGHPRTHAVPGRLPAAQ